MKLLRTNDEKYFGVEAAIELFLLHMNLPTSVVCKGIEYCVLYDAVLDCNYVYLDVVGYLINKNDLQSAIIENECIRKNIDEKYSFIKAGYVCDSNKVTDVFISLSHKDVISSYVEKINYLNLSSYINLKFNLTQFLDISQNTTIYDTDHMNMPTKGLTPTQH